MTPEPTTITAALDIVRVITESMRDETLRYVAILSPQALMRGAGLLAFVVAVAVRRTRRPAEVDTAPRRAA
jgi:hypothetical protein